MSIEFEGVGHSGDEAHHYYRQASIPTSADPVQVGDLWSDTTANVLKRCTSISPVTFVTTEGGAAAHTLDSATHSDVAAATEAKGMVLAWDSVAGAWTGLSVGTDGQQLEADSAQNIGVKWAAAGGGASGTVTTVKEDDTPVGDADIVTLDFGTGFDVAESPDTEVQITLDLSEIAAGGELGGNMDAPTVDVTHSGSAHHAKFTGAEAITAIEGEATLDLAGDVTIAAAKSLAVDTIAEKTGAAGVTIDGVVLKDGVVAVGDVALDDGTSDPLQDADAAADGAENSVARKDHVHPKHHAAVTLVGAPAFLTLAGQVLTRVLVDLTSHVTGVLPAANLPNAGAAAEGIVELATAAETTTGTDAARAVTPDGLAGSEFGERAVQLVVFDWADDTATGDGKYYFHIDSRLAGMNLVDVHALVVVVGTTNTLDIQIHNVTQAADVLSTVITIDTGETGSDTAATPAVIDGANDDVAENDVLRVDIDAVHTTEAKGLIVTLGFRAP